MKRRSKDKIRSNGHLSNILYTAKRPSLSDLELKPLGKAKKKEGMLSALGDKLGQIASSRQTYRPPARHRSRRKGENRAFYLKISAICAAILVVSSLATVVGFAKTGKSVTLNDAGRVISASTDEETVGGFLQRNGIVLQEGDVVTPGEDTPVTENMEIVIHRAMAVEINVDNSQQQAMMLGGTVEQALDNAGITLGEEDEVYPSRDTYIKQGMTIDVIRVKVVYQTEEETLYYKETEKADNTIAAGRRILQTEGQNGLQENTIKVVYKNGVEVSRETTETKVVKEPVDEVVLVGGAEQASAV